MTAHFLKRDFLDHRLGWASLAIFTVLCGGALSVPHTPSSMQFLARQALALAYFLFGFMLSGLVLGSPWRTRHQLSRHYLLALPIPHRTLFMIQHARMLIFWMPAVVLGGAAPVFEYSQWRDFAATDWVLYCFALLTSVALLLELTIWSTLETEGVSSYVPKGQRLWAWLRLIAVTYGVIGLLAVAWSDLVVSRFLQAQFLPKVSLFSVIWLWYWPGLFRIVFPATFVVALLWARQNTRRWCVTV